jgi:3-oxoacyl-[acyl-carrier protein] reductase
VASTKTTTAAAIDHTRATKTRDNRRLMDLGIDGKVALVMGASKGIGRAIAAGLANEGAHVAIASRSLTRLALVATQIGATAFEHDSTNLDAVPSLIGAVTDALGPIEILVTNTGGPPASADPLGNPQQQWEDAYRTLVLAPVELIREVLPGMRERGFGRVVNVASSTVREPAGALILSNSHRAATLAAFKTLSREVAGSGVTLNTVLPGWIATDRLFELQGSEQAAEELARREVPVGRLGTPEELAAAAVFLCSARASYITGVALLVDGGMTRLI